MAPCASKSAFVLFGLAGEFIIRSHQTALLPKSQRQMQTKLDESPRITAYEAPFSEQITTILAVSARTRACFWREALPFSPRSHSQQESISPSSSSNKDLRSSW